MGIFGKVLGGGLGWAVGGPIGAIIGVFVGDVFDSAKKVDPSQMRHRTTGGDFAISLLVLSAAVMKADGKVMRSELNYVKDFYRKQFGPQVTKQQMNMLKEMLKKDIPLEEVCEQIRYNMEHPLRLQLLHYLFGISKADGKVDKSEVHVINKIASYLGISDADFESIKAMFYKDTNAAYKILEIDESVSDADVKKAYRKMAVKYHPDKVASLGEEYAKGAKEKFQKVQEAYETIKSERGMS